MPRDQFFSEAQRLVELAERTLENQPPGQREATTKDRLIEPLLDAMGYGPELRACEGAIRSLRGTREWVDYFLMENETARRPHLMIEAKSLWEENLWETDQDQVLNYLRDYSLMVEADPHVEWIALTNFREWHLVRLGDREPFWSFKMDELRDEAFAGGVYDRLAASEWSRARLLEFYTERQRENLGPRFLRDLKTWRIILANGIRHDQPELDLARIKVASQVILNRFLLTRILEAYGRESYYSLGRLHYLWKSTFRNTPFVELLRQKFEDTWADYNTELFESSWVDGLSLPNDYLELLILPDARPTRAVAAQLGNGLAVVDYRSVYNYDFTTITHDILGTAYEQFLAHELDESDGSIGVIESPATRKREGIYYTPEYVVRYIVIRTLEPRILPILSRALALLEEEAFEEAAEEVHRILEIKILDPACGSGSFLLGAFDYILAAIRRYNAEVDRLKNQRYVDVGDLEVLMSSSEPELVPHPDEQIVVRMLYGVDLDPQAVSLAKLSLWTRLLRTTPGWYGRSGLPHSRLPALTINIRLGNSLIHAPSIPDSLNERISTVADLARVAKSDSRSPEERLDAAVSLESGIEALQPELDYLLTPVFGSEEEAARRRPFHWEVEFPDVLDPSANAEERGFDVVIGNPPYYGVDHTFGSGAPELAWLEMAYPEIYTDKTDILFYFIRQAFNVLKRGGDAAYIVSRAFLQADKARGLRLFLSRETTLLHVLDFLGHRVFHGGIATAILHARNSLPPDGSELVVANVLEFGPVRKALTAGEPLTELPDDALNWVEPAQSQLAGDRWSFGPFGALFSEIDSCGPKLHEVPGITLGQGMQTGANGVFVLDRERAALIEIPEGYLKRRATNSDIRPFGVRETGSCVLYVEDTAYSELPEAVRGWLSRPENSEKLRNRAAVTRSSDIEWYQFTWPLHKDLHFAQKLVAPYRAPENRFAVDRLGEYLGLTDTTHVLWNGSRLDPYALCALLKLRGFELSIPRPGRDREADRPGDV